MNTTHTMKNRLTSAAVIAALSCIMLAGCAKPSGNTTNEAARRVFEAWVRANHPTATQTTLGYYIIENVEGNGELIGDNDNSPYVFAEYVTRDLEGNILSCSSEELAKQLGEYDPTSFYGPTTIYRGENSFYTGLSDALSTMRVGGYKKVAVPGWLLTHEVYDKPEDYIKKEVKIGDPGVYEFKVLGRTNDIVKYQIDSIERYMYHNLAKVDSTSYGFYYYQKEKPSTDEKFKEGANVLINYTGRLLNGQVFDTSIKDTAKFYGIYDPTREYGPATIIWNNTTATEMKMTAAGSHSESDIINGFAFTLFMMKQGEKGTGIFIADHGYGTSGSGSTIPAYSPLRFDIEIIGIDEEAEPDSD